MAYMKTTGGLGAYQKTPVPWTWLRYPPPYAFADPAKIPPPAGVFYADAHEMGMGGCGCGGSCGGCSRGFGAIASSITTALITAGVVATLAGATAYFTKGARRR
jgi:hypothetical protein